LDDFSSFWLRDYTSGWYEGYDKGYPSTNNALESTNNIIKNEGTFREQLPMLDFVKFVERFVTEWSKDRDSKFSTTKHFITQPLISIRQWTLAFQWLKLNKRYVKLIIDQKVFFMFTSTRIEYQATKNTCKSYFEKKDWQSFDDFIHESNSFRFVKFNDSEWKLSECSCPDWDKNFVCKHVIDVAYNLGLCKFPGLDLNIEANTKRGRRKKAQMA